jgi:hypothetical protein
MIDLSDYIPEAWRQQCAPPQVVNLEINPITLVYQRPVDRPLHISILDPQENCQTYQFLTFFNEERKSLALNDFLTFMFSDYINRS